MDKDERVEAGKIVGFSNFAIFFSFFWHFHGNVPLRRSRSHISLNEAPTHFSNNVADRKKKIQRKENERMKERLVLFQVATVQIGGSRRRSLE